MSKILRDHVRPSVISSNHKCPRGTGLSHLISDPSLSNCLTRNGSTEESDEGHDAVDDGDLIRRQPQRPHVSRQNGHHADHRPVEEEVVQFDWQQTRVDAPHHDGRRKKRGKSRQECRVMEDG